MTLAPLPVLLNLRLLACGTLIAAMFIPGLVVVLTNDETHLVVATLTLIAMWGTWTLSVRQRLDRGADEDKPWISAAGSYQAARRDCRGRGLAWAPAGAVVGLVSAPPHIGAWVLPVAAAYSAGIALLAAVRTGTYPLARTAEVLLAAGWGERAGLAALLEDAAARMVLREVKGGYVRPGYRDPALLRQPGALGMATGAPRRGDGRRHRRDHLLRPAPGGLLPSSPTRTTTTTSPTRARRARARWTPPSTSSTTPATRRIPRARATAASPPRSPTWAGWNERSTTCSPRSKVKSQVRRSLRSTNPRELDAVAPMTDRP